MDLNVTGFIVPPLVDLELVVARLGRRIRAGAGIDILSIGVADECDSVIERCTTVVRLLYNTTFVELEGGLARIKSNSKRLLPQLGLHFGDRAFDLSISIDVGYRL